MFALLAITACSPYRDIEDRWTVAREVCEPPTPFVRDDVHPDSYAPITEACRDQLAEDFGVAEQFDSMKVRAWVLEALFNLLGRDQGKVSTLEVDEYVREPFIDHMTEMAEALHTDDLGQLLYNFSAFHITLIIDDTSIDEGFRYVIADQTMLVNKTLEVEQETALPKGSGWATFVVHEASHAVVPGHVMCPDWGTRDCDTDWSGAYGYQAATAWRMYGFCDTEQDAYNCIHLRDEMENAEERILAD
ncbi:MAG: hypothetical protein H6739_38985 [Alphaproteobacteria bacterium]|nr:hypothetical protein [Alphaproteobacteria bacterium]